MNPPTIDVVTLERHAARFAASLPQGESKEDVLRSVLSLLDFTTLEGSETADTIRALCQKAKQPDAHSDSLPSVAAVCVYPQWVELARQQLQGSSVRVATVAADFPHGTMELEAKLREVRMVLDAGAEEVDIVFPRNPFLRGNEEQVSKEIQAIKNLCCRVCLKVILETGRLESYDNIARASMLAMEAGADFLKTSTGKIQPAATLPSALVMMECVGQFFAQTGRRIGIKVAGGLRSAKQASAYWVMTQKVLGPDWMQTEFLRFGASSLLDDLLRELHSI